MTAQQFIGWINQLISGENGKGPLYVNTGMMQAVGDLDLTYKVVRVEGVEVYIPDRGEYYDNLPSLGEDHAQLVLRAARLFPETSYFPDQYQNRRKWLLMIYAFRTRQAEGTGRGWQCDSRVSAKPVTNIQTVLDKLNNTPRPLSVVRN